MDWQPLSTLPQNTPGWVNIRTPDGSVNTYRWLPYKKGAGPIWRAKKGRWQKANEYGWDNNAVIPAEGEWQPNLPIKK